MSRADGVPAGLLSRFVQRASEMALSLQPVRHVVVRVSRKHLLVTGRWTQKCSVCLQEISKSSDSYRCSCGALFHQGCSMFSGSCVSCGNTVTIGAGREHRLWLPKRAVFSQVAEESIVSGFRCLSCDAMVSAEQTYCQNCGFHRSIVNGFMCELCHCEVRPDSYFCRYCGTIYAGADVTLYLCPNCSLVNAKGTECDCGHSL